MIKKINCPALINFTLYERDYILSKFNIDDNLIGEEVKEGFRCFLVLFNSKTYLYNNETQEDVIERFPHLKANINNSIILDGFLFDKAPEYVYSMVRINVDMAIKRQEKKKVKFYAMDCIKINNESITDLPLFQRKVILNEVVAKINNEHIKGVKISKHKEEFYNNLNANNGSGMLYKDINSLYNDNVKYKKRACKHIIKAKILKINKEISSLEYGLLEKGRIINHGQASARKSTIVKMLKENPESLLNKFVTLHYQYVTVKNKLRNARIIEILDQETIITNVEDLYFIKKGGI